MAWRRLLVGLAGGVLVLAAAAAVAWWWCRWTLLRPGPQEATTVTVERGESTAAILADLRDRGLLPSVTVARVYLRLAARGRSPQFGRYAFAAGEQPVDVLDKLLAGEVETVVVTLIEGLSSEEVVGVMVAAGIGTSGEWRALVADPSSISDLAPAATSLEGFLFPDTYRFAAGVPADVVTHRLVDRFRTVWHEEVAAGGSPNTAVEPVVALASLVEGETALDEERAVIAGVYANRLALGMPLQCDPTVVYALKRQGLWQGRLLREHWQIADPYNTYLNPGLPPGPINNPSRASLAAALAPATHDFLYFVAKPDGGHAFSRTLEEHNRAVWRLKQARR